MAQFAPREILLRVTKAQNRDIKLWREGIHHRATTGKSIGKLTLRVAEDRLLFASDFLRVADEMLSQQPERCRCAVSRYYYAMYHAMRAAAFLFHDGDDHQEHRVLPQQTPTDFPDREQWQNRLKDAREVRNRADYDPYPKANSAWNSDASRLAATARELIRVTRVYLRGKGCKRV